MRLKYFFLLIIYILLFDVPCQAVDKGTTADSDISHAEVLRSGTSSSSEGEQSHEFGDNQEVLGESPGVTESPVRHATQLAVGVRTVTPETKNIATEEGAPASNKPAEETFSQTNPNISQDGHLARTHPIASDAPSPPLSQMVKHITNTTPETPGLHTSALEALSKSADENKNPAGKGEDNIEEKEVARQEDPIL